MQRAYKGAPSPIAIVEAGLDSTPGETAEDLEHWRALIHCVTKASGEWRRGFRSDWLGFEIDEDSRRTVEGPGRGVARSEMTCSGDQAGEQPAAAKVSAGAMGGSEGAVSRAEPRARGVADGVRTTRGVRLRGAGSAGQAALRARAVFAIYRRRWDASCGICWSTRCRTPRRASMS